MKKILILILMFIFSTLCFSQSEKQSIDSFKKLKHIVNQKGQKYKASELCVVYDIDNTLITQGQLFGGDTWSSWQRSLKANDKNNVVNWDPNSFKYEFHAFEGISRYFIDYKTTEKDVPNVVDYIKDKEQHPSIALTARDYEHYNSSTERSLLINKLDFSTNPIPDPDSRDNDKTLVLTKNTDGRFFKAYYDGVFYTANDNKGIELLSFIKKVRKDHKNICSSIIFLDNSEHNVDDVFNAFRKNKDVNMEAIHYVTKYDNVPSKEALNEWGIQRGKTASHYLNEFIKKVNS